MRLLKISREELSQEEIIAHLGELRLHALVESSHFAVASVMALRLEDGSFAYVSGVNVENAEHNRLSMHAEQNAITAAQSLFGGNIKFIKGWVMGAPDSIAKGSEHFLADNFITPCGHCRQILLSLSSPETEMFSVTVNGKVATADHLPALLPKAFSELDLAIAPAEGGTKASTVSKVGLFAEPVVASPSRFLNLTTSLSDLQLRAAGAGIVPHLIEKGFQTSPIQACMIKVSHHDAVHYFSGALVQDIAFLTTDAVFAGLGQAVTEFGGKDLFLQEVNLFGASLNPDQVSGSELQHIARFSTPATRIKFHTRDETSPAYTIEECFDAFAKKTLVDLHSRAAVVLCSAPS